VYKILWNEAVNASVTALCDSHWLTWWSGCILLLELVWLRREYIKQCNWLQFVVITDERFVGALRMGDETPRYLYNLSNGCSVCESGRIEICVGDITN